MGVEVQAQMSEPDPAPTLSPPLPLFFVRVDSKEFNHSVNPKNQHLRTFSQVLILDGLQVT